MLDAAKISLPKKKRNKKNKPYCDEELTELQKQRQILRMEVWKMIKSLNKGDMGGRPNEIMIVMGEKRKRMERKRVNLLNNMQV